MQVIQHRIICHPQFKKLYFYALLLICLISFKTYSQSTVEPFTLNSTGGNYVNRGNFALPNFSFIWSVGEATMIETFTTGTSGVDFNIISSGTVHTFNIPTASTFARGLLTSTDYTSFNTAYNNRITSLTTTGTGGAATLSANTLNIPAYTITGLGGVPSTRTINGLDLSANRTFTTTDIAEGTKLYWTAARSRAQQSLTVTGTSGASTYDNSTGILNIPTYILIGLGGVPSTRTINGIDLSANQAFSTGTTGTDFNINFTGTTHFFNIPNSSGTARGLLTSADWTSFNNKWSLSGNGGLTAGTNFLGTTDANELQFKVNSTWAGQLHPTRTTTSFGVGAGQNTTVVGNTAFGFGALNTNITGVDNTAIGNGAL